MLHILIGDFNDIETIDQALEQTVSVIPWIVPKNAKTGDKLLIFFRHINAIFGSGEILSTPFSAKFGNRHVYRANIGIGAPIDPFLTIEELSELFPEWAWVRYPRTYTTPSNEIAEKLWKIASSRFIEELYEHEDLPEAETYIEGSVKRVLVNQYERDALAREKCLDHHGTVCSICGFDFSKCYGDSMSGFIHVHHINPLSDIGKEYQVNPITDLMPICPNCHAVIHSKKIALSPDKVKDLLVKNRKEA